MNFFSPLSATILRLGQKVTVKVKQGQAGSGMAFIAGMKEEEEVVLVLVVLVVVVVAAVVYEYYCRIVPSTEWLSIFALL